MTLIELVVVLVIIMALAASSIVVVDRLTAQTWDEVTDRRLGKATASMMKVHDDGGLGGFLNDMGRLPRAPELLLYDQYMNSRDPIDHDYLLQWGELTEGKTSSTPIILQGDSFVGGNDPRNVLPEWKLWTATEDDQIQLYCGWRGPYCSREETKNGWGVPFRAISDLNNSVSPVRRISVQDLDDTATFTARDYYQMEVVPGVPTRVLGGEIGGWLSYDRNSSPQRPETPLRFQHIRQSMAASPSVITFSGTASAPAMAAYVAIRVYGPGKDWIPDDGKKRPLCLGEIYVPFPAVNPPSPRTVEFSGVSWDFDGRPYSGMILVRVYVRDGLPTSMNEDYLTKWHSEPTFDANSMTDNMRGPIKRVHVTPGVDSKYRNLTHTFP